MLHFAHFSSPARECHALDSTQRQKDPQSAIAAAGQITRGPPLGGSRATGESEGGGLVYRRRFVEYASGVLAGSPIACKFPTIDATSLPNMNT